MPACHHFNNLRAIAEKLDKGYLVCLAAAAKLPQTRPQFGREIVAETTDRPVNAGLVGD